MINDLPMVIGIMLFVAGAVAVAVGPFMLIRTRHAALLPDRATIWQWRSACA